MSASIKLPGKSVVTLAATAAAALLSGCTFYEGDHHRDHDRVIVEERRDYRPVPPPPPPRTSYRERVLIQEGRHYIEFRAPRSGLATVVDMDDRQREIISVPLARGDRLTFDPDKNKAYVNDRKIYEHDIKSKHLYRIYFQEGR